MKYRDVYYANVTQLLLAHALNPQGQRWTRIPVRDAGVRKIVSDASANGYRWSSIIAASLPARRFRLKKSFPDNFRLQWLPPSGGSSQRLQRLWHLADSFVKSASDHCDMVTAHADRFSRGDYGAISRATYPRFARAQGTRRRRSGHYKPLQPTAPAATTGHAFPVRRAARPVRTDPDCWKTRRVDPARIASQSGHDAAGGRPRPDRPASDAVLASIEAALGRMRRRPPTPRSGDRRPPGSAAVGRCGPTRRCVMTRRRKPADSPGDARASDHAHAQRRPRPGLSSGFLSSRGWGLDRLVKAIPKKRFSRIRRVRCADA